LEAIAANLHDLADRTEDPAVAEAAGLVDTLITLRR